MHNCAVELNAYWMDSKVSWKTFKTLNSMCFSQGVPPPEFDIDFSGFDADGTPVDEFMVNACLSVCRANKSELSVTSQCFDSSRI